MAENKAVIGLDYIAWGYGEVEVPTYNGKTRRIQRINFENVPFNESKTVGQALNELNTLLTSQHYQTVSDNIERIKRVFFDLDAIQSVDLNKMNIDAVAGAIDEIRLVYLHLGALAEIQQMLPEYRKDKQNIEYLKCKIGRMIEDLRNTVQKANTLLYSKFEPMFNQLTAMEARLTALISNAVATVTNGNEMAVKLATYRLEIERKPNCWNPKVIVDDVNQRIVWQVPTVKGDCAVVEPDEALVRDSVNAYLATLPNLNGLSNDMKRLIDANTQIGKNVGTANNIVLRNPLWAATGITDYPDDEQIYFAYLKQTNTGSMTMKVEGRPEYEVSIPDREHSGSWKEIPANYIEPYNLYGFKLEIDQRDDGTTYNRWVLISFSQAEAADDTTQEDVNDAV